MSVAIVMLLLRYWIDTADKQPCVGTGGMIPWKLHVTGRLFHSGLAHKVCSYVIHYNSCSYFLSNGVFSMTKTSKLTCDVSEPA